MHCKAAFPSRTLRSSRARCIRPARSSMSTTPLRFLLSKRCVPTSLRMRAALTSNTSIGIVSRGSVWWRSIPIRCTWCKTRPRSLALGSELDAVYRLPYMRTYHPFVRSAGGVPAIAEVKFEPVEQPRMLRRVLFLRFDVSPGAYCAVKEQGVARRRGEAVLRRS